MFKVHSLQTFQKRRPVTTKEYKFSYASFHFVCLFQSCSRSREYHTNIGKPNVASITVV